MFKRLTWYSIMIIAVVGLVFLSAGFFKAMKVTSGGNTATAVKTTKAENNPIETSAAPKESNSIKIVIMGDSIAKGTGDEKGKGFSGYLPDYMKNQTPKEIFVENIGTVGLKSAGLLEQLQNEKLDPLLSSSDIVLLSIGGNDIRSLQYMNDTTKEDKFKDTEDNYLKNLKEILRIIRKNSANTYIIFVGLYNPYERSTSSNEDTKLTNTWNYDTQQIIEANAKMVFVPTFDIFKFNLNRFIAPDGLHPNSLGYQAIADRISKSIEGIFSKS